LFHDVAFLSPALRDVFHTPMAPYSLYRYDKQICNKHCVNRVPIFRLGALALSVIATATWLAGWLSVTAGIVSKRLNLS